MKLKNTYITRRGFFGGKLSVAGCCLSMIIFCAIFLFPNCSRRSQRANGTTLSVFPDYSGAAIPVNIAPLNFYIHYGAHKYRVSFAMGKDSFSVVCRNEVAIPSRKWKKLLLGHAGENLHIAIYARENKNWEKIENKTLYVAPEPVDPYIVYRLIEPGYQYWGKMGIYQRCIENFDEIPVMINTLTDENCMNCHSFCKNDPDKMLFHMRAQHAGTLFVNNGKIEKMNMKVDGNISAAVYPRWHPEGRYVAFSVNKTSQLFHAVDENLIEVYDAASDLIIYDTETQIISSGALIHSTNNFETFPEWSPDGKWLYFCSAPAQEMPDGYDSLRYNLFRIGFDAQTGKTGNRIDTVLMASLLGKSAAFPRISPDGKYLMLCLSGYGTFPIWHKDNDLYLLNLETRELAKMNSLNSRESDSYHSWSSNGRWVVFGSRRLDGLYTRPFIAYFDNSGKAHPPFLLPQKNPLLYDQLIKSFNIPEFITGKIKPGLRTMERVAKEPAINAKSQQK